MAGVKLSCKLFHIFFYTSHHVIKKRKKDTKRIIGKGAFGILFK